MQDKNLLDSWKEIASYLGRSERTCRRWENEYGLPIYRMDGSPRASVFAYKEKLDRWMDEMLHEKKISSRKSFFLSRKNLVVILSLAIISILILSIAVSRILPRKTKVSSLSSKPSLAILYFKNNTGKESLDYWRRALCDLLISDLSQSRYLTVLPEDRLFHILRNLNLLETEAYATEDLERIASQAQVDNILFGNYNQAGESIRLNVSIRKMSSEEDIVLKSIEGKSEEEIFSMVDELSRKAKERLGLFPHNIDNDLDEETEIITTRSIVAYKYYTEGRSHYRAGHVKDSIPPLEKAIEIDPEFAMAYRLLAMSYGSLPGYEDKSNNAFKKAFELRHRVSERERLLIQAQNYRSQSERTWGDAIKSFQELLQIYPDDYLAITHLGSLYRHIEDWDKAVETLKKITHIYHYSSHFAHLRRALCAQGNYTEALEIAERIPAEIFPFNYPYQLTLNLFCHRKLDLALLEVEKMLDRSPEFLPALRLRGDIWLCKENWMRAEENYAKCLGLKGLDINKLRNHNRGIIRLASLSIAQGKFERAIDYYQQGIDESKALGEKQWSSYFHWQIVETMLKKRDINEAIKACQIDLGGRSIRGQIKALHLKGLIFVELNDIGEAQEAADEMRREVENWLNPKLMRYYHHLMGHIELKTYNMAEAIASFEKANALLPYQYDPDGDEHAPFYDSLAYAFYEAGDLERSREWYERIHSLTLGRLPYGDVYAKSFFMLGKIYEQKGWAGKAIENFNKFLDLWDEADPGIPEIEEARQRLIALQN